jgi:hypothetical protein
MSVIAFRVGGIWFVVNNGRRGWAPTFAAAVRLSERRPMRREVVVEAES